jgi:ankyrin repeat protein
MSEQTQTLNDAFEQAIDALINGDIETLQLLLAQYPTLTETYSTQEHHGTLLHYVAANGVEDERQKTPSNILEITRSLLEAGTNPNAVGDMYDGSSILTALVSSIHPAQAGKQADLVRLLCEFGAKANGVKDDGLPLRTSIIFCYPKAVEALANCGARIDNVVFAAALGKLDLVKQFIEQGVEEYIDAFGFSYEAPQQVLEVALRAASMMGHLDIVEFLLQTGVDINAKYTPTDGTALHEACNMNHIDIVHYLLGNQADITKQDNNGMTPLHWAAWHGHLDLIDLLLVHHAPLEIKNKYGGTVLDATVHNLVHSFYPIDKPLTILKKLVDAGADVMAVEPYPTGNSVIDDFLKSHRK